MSEKEQANERLEHFPVNIFAIVMGLGGFSIATHKFESIMGWGALLSTALTVFTMVVFALLAAIYLMKIFKYPTSIKQEWRHPIKISFFPAITISIIILSICLLPLSKEASAVLWWIGAPLNLLTAMFVINFWINEHHYEQGHINPVWFIPAVGNILVPIVGVVHASPEISWFFFAAGIMFWIILLTIVFNRLVFHNPLPEKLLPTLFILIAPPAVGFLSYTRLMDGALDPFARILYHAGLLFFLLLIMRAAKFTRIKFALSWWAYSFPLAAFTLSTLRFGELVKMPMVQTLGIAVYGLLTAVIAILLVRTVNAVINKKICVPE